MHKFYKSLFDASVYLQQPAQNAGVDEIIEVGKLYYGDIKDIYRTLIKFDITPISASIAANEISGTWTAYLNLTTAVGDEIPIEYTIYANAVSQSWSMGTGTKFDNITSDGVSWKYRDGTNLWQSSSIGGSAIFTPGTTGSANAEGGTWYTASEASQTFNYELDDIRMDVTDIVTMWTSGSISNDGFIVHHSLANEANTQDYGALKFYSKETGTIFQPKLEIVWDDSTFQTGSLSPITGSVNSDTFENSKIVITNLRNSYLTNTKTRIRIKGRDKYPAKTFGSVFQYDQSKFLPTSSFYQIEDYIANTVLIPFGDYSKISCDSVSNYFDLDTQDWPVDRVYSLKLKIVLDGVTYLVTDKYTFEVVDN